MVQMVSVKEYNGKQEQAAKNLFNKVIYQHDIDGANERRFSSDIWVKPCIWNPTSLRAQGKAESIPRDELDFGRTGTVWGYFQQVIRHIASPFDAVWLRMLKCGEYYTGKVYSRLHFCSDRWNNQTP